MNVIANILTFLKKIDPEYYRLKHASKTVIAVALAIVLTMWASNITIMLAAIAAGASMQGIVDERRRHKLMVMLIADTCYLLSYIAAATLKVLGWPVDLFLIIVAFLALYLRRFGPRFGFTSIVLWLFAFFGKILPTVTSQQLLLNIAGILIGFFAGIVVMLLLFSENRRRLFYNNTAHLAKLSQATLRWLMRSLSHHSELADFQQTKKYYKSHIMQCIEHNEQALVTMAPVSKGINSRLSKLLMIEYSLIKAVAIMIEGCEHLIEQPLTLSKSLMQTLNANFLHLIAACDELEVYNRRENIQLNADYLAIDELLKKLRTNLMTCDFERKAHLAPAINLQLGLHLFWKNLQRLAQ